MTNETTGHRLPELMLVNNQGTVTVRASQKISASLFIKERRGLLHLTAAHISWNSPSVQEVACLTCKIHCMYVSPHPSPGYHTAHCAVQILHNLRCLESEFVVRSDRIATGLQRSQQIARSESRGQTPFELLLRLYSFYIFEIGLKSRNSIR